LIWHIQVCTVYSPRWG